MTQPFQALAPKIKAAYAVALAKHEVVFTPSEVVEVEENGIGVRTTGCARQWLDLMSSCSRSSNSAIALR